MKILNAEQVRKWDAYTIEQEQLTSWELMERASAQCTKWIIANGFAPRPIKIFCGKGNNGGDGLAIARQLTEKGFSVHVFILEFGNLGTPDFQQNLTRLHSLSVPFQFIQEAAFFPEIDASDVVVDALYGTGVNRPLQDLSEQLVQYINASEATIISIDLPSGMFADKSSVPNPVIKAEHTLTFEALKFCFLLPENEVYFGQVHVLPIGLAPAYLADVDSRYEYVDHALASNIFKPRKRFSHKGDFGHALIVAGFTGKMGAALLVSKACLRSGAGLVTALLNEADAPIMHIGVPEAMVAFRDGDIDFTKYTCIGIGPGLGTSGNAEKLVEQTITTTNAPLVIDADAINILAKRDDLYSHLSSRTILSPHVKEFERLFGETLNDYERLELAINKATELQVIIILKGHRTATIVPGGNVYFNSTGNPGMATAGSGDVLTGILTGLVAQGYVLHEAAILGVYLHGLAGDMAARQLSEEAMIAGDITRHLGQAFKKLIA